ncbi:hypothetical protein SAMCCGM7_Ch2261 [Sinorhizobium americanum CCGM7]|nr:hypothetical protein SAMCCGM7_Ch2261 [Sinorhizobium americanum CCGM7]
MVVVRLGSKKLQLFRMAESRAARAARPMSGSWRIERV